MIILACLLDPSKEDNDEANTSLEVLSKITPSLSDSLLDKFFNTPEVVESTNPFRDPRMPKLVRIPLNMLTDSFDSSVNEADQDEDKLFNSD